MSLREVTLNERYGDFPGPRNATWAIFLVSALWLFLEMLLIPLDRQRSADPSRICRTPRSSCASSASA